MKKRIPTYPLTTLAGTPRVEEEGILLVDRKLNASDPLDIPHRTGYYGIGLCIHGKASIVANLEDYTISVGSLILMSPHIVKQWTSISDNFQTVAVLFTDRFFNPTDDQAKRRFLYFQNIARNIIPLNPKQAEQIQTTLQFIHRKYAVDYKDRDAITKELIKALLFEVASLYEAFDQSMIVGQTRAQTLTAEFKKLVKIHFATERSVSYYAEQLFVSSRHLTETVRETSGRTPGEWITEAVILEAKVLLLDPSLTISFIADQLQFADPSTFGKYFKNSTSMSPAQYRASH